jgi:hypothetical protein
MYLSEARKLDILTFEAKKSEKNLTGYLMIFTMSYFDALPFDR